MRNIIYLALICILMSSCDKYKEKDFEDLEYLPVLPNEILVVINEDTHEEFPTILKFSPDEIIISRFRDSDEYNTGYENVNLKVLNKSFIEDDDFQLTKFKTDLNTITLSANKANKNVYYIEGLDTRKKLTLIGISENLLKQIKNLKSHEFKNLLCFRNKKCSDLKTSSHGEGSQAIESGTPFPKAALNEN